MVEITKEMIEHIRDYTIEYLNSDDGQKLLSDYMQKDYERDKTELGQEILGLTIERDDLIEELEMLRANITKFTIELEELERERMRLTVAEQYLNRNNPFKTQKDADKATKLINENEKNGIKKNELTGNEKLVVDKYVKSEINKKFINSLVHSGHTLEEALQHTNSGVDRYTAQLIVLGTRNLNEGKDITDNRSKHLY